MTSDNDGQNLPDIAGLDLMGQIMSANATAAANTSNQLLSSAHHDAAKWALRLTQFHSYMAQAVKSGNMFQIVHTIEGWNYTIAAAHDAIDQHTKLAEMVEGA